MIGLLPMELTQQLHADQMEVICNPIHQPNPMIYTHPSHHHNKAGKTSEFSLSFMVQISNTGLSELRTEWKPWVLGTILHSHACEQSMSTTSQKNLSTCIFLLDSTHIADSSSITDVHHLTIDWAFRIVDIVDNFNSSLRRAVLTHAPAPSFFPLPCPVSK